MFLKVFKNLKSFKNSLKQQLNLIHGFCLEILFSVLVSYTGFRSRWITATVKLCASSSKWCLASDPCCTCVEVPVSLEFCALKVFILTMLEYFLIEIYHTGTESRKVGNNWSCSFMLTLPVQSYPTYPFSVGRVGEVVSASYASYV